MALKTFKPYTKSTRGTVVVDKSNLWKGSSYKPLTKGQYVTGGRNNAGRITSRHMGGGSKHKFRIIDFFRKKKDMIAVVDRIEYDPNRTAYIALITYEDKEKLILLALKD
jgi:Ribosomal protein L2